MDEEYTMSNEKKLEILRQIKTDVWDEERGHLDYRRELRMSVALLIDYYQFGINGKENRYD